MNLYKGIDHQQLAHIWYISITTVSRSVLII